MSGNPITLGGAIINNSTSLETLNFDIATIAVRTITTSSGGGDVTLGGVFNGTGGGITLAGNGTLTLSGSTANTYTGTTTVTGGTLALSKSSGVAAVSPNLTIGNNVDPSGTAIVQLNADNQITDDLSPNPFPVTVNSSGKLDLSGHTDFIPRLVLSGGTVTTGAGTNFLGMFHNQGSYNGGATAAVQSNSSSTTATISGRFDLNNDGAAGHSMVIDVAPPSWVLSDLRHHRHSARSPLGSHQSACWRHRQSRLRRRPCRRHQ
jgi:autotransporter-associated beta strand protein